MDWCVTDDPKLANHNPIAVLNGDSTKQVLNLRAAPGATVVFTAEGSHDPDGHAIESSWFIYREAGTFEGEVKLSALAGETTELPVPAQARPGATIHLILQLRDRGTPALFAYRRAVVTVGDAGTAP